MKPDKDKDYDVAVTLLALVAFAAGGIVFGFSTRGLIHHSACVSGAGRYNETTGWFEWNVPEQTPTESTK